MASSPNPKSYSQILGEMLSSYMARIGVNDLNEGSVVVSFFEAMAQAVYRTSGDIFAILRDFSVDRATGEALKRIAKEENIKLEPARVSTGTVKIKDTSFEKIATKIYAGAASPNIGSTTIKVSDASDFPATGSIYIGRGTSNIEGPIAYTSVSSVGGFYIINLATPTTKYHNINESVILSQGGVRTIPAGTVLTTDGSGATPGVTFTTTKKAVILDGENEIDGIPVSADTPGAQGNIPANTLKNFSSPPFAGATVTNEKSFTTGKDEQTDDEIRNAIKRARISRGLGTAIAVKNSVLGVKATDENAVVVSSQIFSDGEQTTLFIDDGKGYEEKTQGVGFETLVDSAIGGEQFFQLSTGGKQTSVAKAFLESTNKAPYDIRENDKLAILVGGKLSEHTFKASDFRTEGSATAFEVAASINSNSTITFSARTIENGTKVTIFAKEEKNEYLKVTTPTTGRDASKELLLQTNEVETLKLYKNNIPLSRNGRPAIIESEPQTNWLNTIQDGDTLAIDVDGTGTVVYFFYNSDFADEGTHQTVANTNTIESWVNVINKKITGITASINGSSIVLTSNLGSSSRASIVIDNSSTLVQKGMFSDAKGLEAYGKESDYLLSRNTAQIKLTKPLAPGDSLTAGSDSTEATIKSGTILGGSVSFDPAEPKPELWIVVDNNDALIISHGAAPDTNIEVSKPASNIIRYKSVIANAFNGVKEGDYVIIWSKEVNSANRLEGRVHSVGSDSNPYDYFEIKVTASEFTSATPEITTFREGLAFVRTEIAPQKASIPTGTYSVSEVAGFIKDQLVGIKTFVENEEIIGISTLNKKDDGAILLVTYNDAAKKLNFTAGASSVTSFSHFGFLKTDVNSYKFPAFVNGSFSQDRIADPPNTAIPDLETSVDISTIGAYTNDIIVTQNPFLSSGIYVNDATNYDVPLQIDYITGTNVNIDESKLLRRVRVGDRFYVLKPLDFQYNDSITFILDGDPSAKTFPINLYRRAETNSTAPANANDFRAYDLDAGTGTEFSTFFGASFDFKNFKALMKARGVLDPVGNIDEDALLFRASIWGEAGNRYKVGYVYPTSDNKDISHTIEVKDFVDIRISLKSGNPITTTIDGTTEWDVTVNTGVPVATSDEVTYTYNGTGSAPGLAALQPGHYVTISTDGEFHINNTGTFRIVSATATSFTVRRPTGVAVAETGKATLSTGTFLFYENIDTTAQDIKDYIDNNLTDWITAEVIDDNGLTGAGIISESTYENNNFASNTETITLVDGINYIESSNLSSAAPNPQFKFKTPLSLVTYDTNTTAAYSFNGGEEIRLIPTTIEQTARFMNVLAVSGITTLSEIIAVKENEELQITTDVLGAAGSVIASGGTANKASAKVISTASTINGLDLIRLDIDRANFPGFGAGSWIYLKASNLQKKTIGINETTKVTITPLVPTPTQSTIELTTRDITDRFFGEPRNNFRDRGRAFHVEKQGSLVAISWDGITGTDPLFTKNVDINDGAGDIDVSKNSALNITEYTIITGSRNFREVAIGDTVTFSGFVNPENNGTFEVIGVSDDGLTIAVNNPNVIAETTNITAGLITVTTAVKEGDLVEIGAPFASLNQGQFRVFKVAGNTIYIKNDLAVEERVVVSSTLRPVSFDNTTQWDIDTTTGRAVLTWNGTGTAPDLSSVRMGDVVKLGTAFSASNQGEYLVVNSDTTFVELLNASATSESGVTASSVGGDVLEFHTPCMIFSDYDNTRIGDTFNVSGNVLGADNKGSFTIVDVISKYKAVVSDVMVAVSLVQLNELYTQVYIQEQFPYEGYKRVYNMAINPANPNQGILIVQTKENAEKITELSETYITAQGKLGFPSDISIGYDSYKYNTGLIRESNRTVYGDPRDSITFPGVAAAGAEIFISAPLFRKVTVSINIRVRTGIPFARLADQVRNNIASLINGSKIGESIAISSIIASVNSIPGVRAVSITFPEFNVDNDLINLNPGEKAVVLDLINDITVNKVE